MDLENREFLSSLLPQSSNFELRLAPNVYWVPFTTLGPQTLTYNEIFDLVKRSPEEKKDAIHTLFDAIQLFVACDFQEMDDTKKITENRVEWEFYKSGRLSVLSNCGCCSSCCSWLIYLLNGKYNDIGIVGVLRYKKSGHAINYIMHDGWYYIVDLQPLLRSYRQSISPQTGLRTDFLRTGFITGILCKSKSLEDYVAFYARFMTYQISEHIFLKECSDRAIPLGKIKDSTTDIVYLPYASPVSLIKQKRKINHMRYEWARLSEQYL